VDRSKNTALIPPTFGSPTSYLPGSGEYLTPNLVPGALSGGLVNQAGSVGNPNGGTLKIPSIGLTVKVFEGTGTAPLLKGAGHFEGTSIWDGNVPVAGHNRGCATISARSIP